MNWVSFKRLFHDCEQDGWSCHLSTLKPLSYGLLKRSSHPEHMWAIFLLSGKVQRSQSIHQFLGLFHGHLCFCMVWTDRNDKRNFLSYNICSGRIIYFISWTTLVISGLIKADFRELILRGNEYLKCRTCARFPFQVKQLKLMANFVCLLNWLHYAY